MKFPIDKTDEWESRQDAAKQRLSEIEVKAIAAVAQLTQSHDDAVERFYRNRNATHIFHENEIIGKFVKYAVDSLRREQELQARAEKAEADAQRMYEALKPVLKFCEQEQECREYSFLPEPTDNEEDYLTEASETVETIRAAIAAHEEK